MHLVEILLPINSSPPTEQAWSALKNTLVTRFGGLTAFTRSPAKGIWLSNGRKERDDVVIIEVMVEVLDRDWWTNLRTELERALQQEEIVVRSQIIERH